MLVSDGFNLVFSVDFLLNSSTELKRDLHLRTSFVNYIKDCEWRSNLDKDDSNSCFTNEILLNNISTMQAAISKRVQLNESELTHDYSQLTVDEELPLFMKSFFE